MSSAIPKSLFPVCLLVLFNSQMLAQQAAPDSWVKIVEAASPAVVVIETDTGLGSGFLLKADGTIVTCYHVIAGAKTLSVRLASGELFRRSYLLAIDESKDLAILRIEGAYLPFVIAGNSNECKIGEDVILLGAPSGLEQSVSNGVLSGIRLTDSGVRVMQTTAAASPGSSGGPMLNRKGEVVGVLSFSVVRGQNLNFVIPINYVRGLLDTLSMTQMSPLRVLDGGAITKRPSDVSGQKSPGGVMLGGYGEPADSFQYVFIELMNFLAANGVRLANQPSKFSPVQSDIVSLNYYLSHLVESGAEYLLYLILDSGYAQTDRLTIQCFDAGGKLLWKEESKSSWAMSLKGAAKSLLKSMQKKLKARIGQPGLPLRKE